MTSDSGSLKSQVKPSLILTVIVVITITICIMSISHASFESLIDFTARFIKRDPLYNTHPPLYYTDAYHIPLVCEILAVLLEKKQIKVCCTKQFEMIEPITHFEDVIIICIPLLAYLVNTPVEIPKPKLEVMKNYDILKSLKPKITINEDISKKQYQTNNFDEFNQTESIRFIQTLRVVLAAVHYHHYHVIKKLNYTESHDKGVNIFELAKSTATNANNYNNNKHSSSMFLGFGN